MLKSNDNANISNSGLLDIACELDGASEAFHDISVLTNLIQKNLLSMSEVISVVRQIQLNAETWSNLLDHNKENIEKIVGRTVKGD